VLEGIELRSWCRRLARGLIRQDILRESKPYLMRYFVAGWSPTNQQTGPAVFLHHFVASDPPASVHSHPWTSVSLILAGGYREHRCDADGRASVREFRPGAVNLLVPTDRHRIELLEVDCWTLFLVGDFEQAWAFFPACT
jgi:hypothetical protein